MNLGSRAFSNLANKSRNNSPENILYGRYRRRRAESQPFRKNLNKNPYPLESLNSTRNLLLLEEKPGTGARQQIANVCHDTEGEILIISPKILHSVSWFLVFS